MPVNLYHTLILSNGKVFSSGKDDCNQLGRAGKPWLFTEVDSPIRFVSVGAGCDGNSVAVAEDGSLWGWGANFKYQIGLPKMKIHHTPEKALIPDVTFVSVSAGDTFCIALDSEGFVWEFGEIYVQKRTHEPEKVPMIHNIRVICAGGYYSTALDYNGRVWSWGRNDDGQLGIGNMGDCSTPQVICGIGPIQQLATGYRHSLLLDMDGQVWTFGANPDGRLGLGNLGAKHFASSPVIIPELSNASHVWCGACASYVLDAAGDLWVFGCNEDFELGMQLDGKVFTPTQHVFRPVEILPSNRYAFFVGEGGILYASGSNENGQLGLPISRRECFKLIPDFIYYGKKLVQVKSARK